MSEEMKIEKMIEFVTEVISFFDDNIEKAKHANDKRSARDWTIRRVAANDILKGLTGIKNS